MTSHVTSSAPCTSSSTSTAGPIGVTQFQCECGCDVIRQRVTFEQRGEIGAGGLCDVQDRAERPRREQRVVRAPENPWAVGFRGGEMPQERRLAAARFTSGGPVPALVVAYARRSAASASSRSRRTSTVDTGCLTRLTPGWCSPARALQWDRATVIGSCSDSPAPTDRATGGGHRMKSVNQWLLDPRPSQFVSAGRPDGG